MTLVKYLRIKLIPFLIIMLCWGNFPAFASGVNFNDTDNLPVSTNNPKLRGNVGMGTTLATNTLDVQGGVGIGTAYAGYQTAPSNGLVVQGNVGIGTAAPTGKLEIEGGNVGIGTAFTTASALAVMSGNIGIGTWVSRASLDISHATDAIILPSGTTTQEPSTAVNGMARYNSSYPYIESYQNSGWKAVNGAAVLCQSGAASSHTGDTNETNLAVCTVPAGIMGANGRLHVDVLYTFVGTHNAKRPEIRLSTTSGDTSGGTLYCDNTTAGSIGVVNSLTYRTQFDVGNANSTSSQIGYVAINIGTGSSGYNGNANTTSSIDTTSAFYINFNCLDANHLDTCTLSGYDVILIEPM